MKDNICLALILLGALGAENIPFLAVMTLLAGVISFLPARSGDHYYRICPHCGAHLDPGEPCDCQEEDPDRKEHKTPTTKSRPLRPGVQFGHLRQVAI